MCFVSIIVNLLNIDKYRCKQMYLQCLLVTEKHYFHGSNITVFV